MNASAREVRGTVVPTLRYRDVAAAIDWLCTAFGFEKHLVVGGEDGSVRYAQLAFGDGLIMLGSVEDSAADGLMAQPEDTGGLETQICYLFVDDARTHCARAKAAGAQIVLDVDDETSVGRGYSCRDPEGHVWNFGTYDPRQRQSVRPPPSRARRGVKRLALVVGMLANAITSIAFLGWVYAATEHTFSAAYASVPADAASRDDRAANEARERAVREAREQLARERSAKDAAERSAREARDQMARERSAKEQAERAVAAAREQLAQERSAKATTEPALNDLRAALQKAEQAAAAADGRVRVLEQAALKAREDAALERSGKEAAERAASDAKEQAGKERSAKEAAERAARRAREEAAARAQPKKAAPKVKSSSGSSSSGGSLIWQ